MIVRTAGGIEERLAAQRRAAGLQQVAVGGGLQHVAGRAGVQRLEEVLVDVVHRQHQDLQPRPPRAQLARGGQAGAARHRDVEDRQVDVVAQPSSTASIPSPASATTCRSGAASSTWRSPRRTIAWSSAIRTPAFSGTPSRRDRHRQPDDGPAAGARRRPPARRRPAARARACPARRCRPAASAQARAVVGDLEHHHVVLRRPPGARPRPRRAWRATLVSASCATR